MSNPMCNHKSHSTLCVLGWMIVLIFLFPNIAAAQTPEIPTTDQSLGLPIEGNRYKDKVLSHHLNYDLIANADGSFVLRFVTIPEGPFQIKIFDLIGNLLVVEQIEMSGSYEKEYRFSESANKIYVVKVVSGEEKLIKKINI